MTATNLEKVTFLESELANAIGEIDGQRRRYRSMGFFLRVTTVVFSATITVLLGFKGSGLELSTAMANIALVLGAAITVFSAVDAFFEYRSLWIQKQITWMSLRELNRSLNYYKAGVEQDTLDPKKITYYLNELNDILNNDQRGWLKLRDESLLRHEQEAE